MGEAGPLERVLPSTFLRCSVGLHAAGLAALVFVPGRWPVILGAVVLNHAAIAAAGLLPRSRLLGPNLCRLDGPSAASAVALTFDDGPDPEVTPRVLDLLERHRAQATFFFIGRRAERHPELVAEVVRRGHRVENHSYGHSNAFALLGPSRLGAELDRAQRTLERLTGRRPVYFRAPAGIRSPFLNAALVSRGLRLVSWTRRGFDTVSASAERVGRRLLRGLAAGDVILLHDGSAAREQGEPVVLRCLPPLLERLAAMGLRGVALPDPGAPESR